MKRYSSRVWKRILGDDLVKKGICTVDFIHTYLIKNVPQIIYKLVLIQDRLQVLVKNICIISTTFEERYSITIQLKSGDKYTNMVTCTFDDVKDIKTYLKTGLLNSHDPKKLIDSLREYYPDHHTEQYKISRKIVTIILSDLDLQYSEFHQGVFTFWLRGIKVVVDSEGHIEVRSIMVGDRILATYAGNEYGLRNFELYYFITYQEV